MFTTEHFLWIGISAVIIGVLLFLSLKQKWSYKKAVYVMCGFAIVSELCKIFTHIEGVNGVDYSGGGYMRAVSLPFHLCSIFVFAYFYMAFSKNEKNKEIVTKFFVPVGLFGALLAILMATSGTDFTKPFAYQCFVYHAAMLWLALYFVISKQVTLTFKDYLRNLLMLGILAILMIWINGALITCGCDTANFCFVVRPPASGLPLLNLNHGWYAYFAHLAFCGILLETLAYLPYFIVSKTRKA